MIIESATAYAVCDPTDIDLVFSAIHSLSLTIQLSLETIHHSPFFSIDVFHHSPSSAHTHRD